MDKISTILIPFDFSEISVQALTYAVGFIGMDRDIKIVLAHIALDGTKEHSEADFKNIKENYVPKFRGSIEWFRGRGSLTESILQVQSEQAIDLVIMGTSGAHDNKEIVISNTANLALEIDNCPVLVIPKDFQEFSIKKIALVLGKDNIDDKSALQTLLRLACRFDAKVDVLTIQNEDGIYGYSKTDESNENLLEYYLENFYSHHAFIEDPDILRGIADYAERNTIDMVAILPKNHAHSSAPSEGLLTKELTMRSTVPILVID